MGWISSSLLLFRGAPARAERKSSLLKKQPR
jgi:hypothetical protein